MKPSEETNKEKIKRALSSFSAYDHGSFNVIFSLKIYYNFFIFLNYLKSYRTYFLVWPTILCNRKRIVQSPQELTRQFPGDYKLQRQCHSVSFFEAETSPLLRIKPQNCQLTVFTKTRVLNINSTEKPLTFNLALFSCKRSEK